MKQQLKKIVPASIWKRLRTRSIIRQHARVAKICESLIDEFGALAEKPRAVALKPELAGRKIIWQFWAQGYEHVPEVVRECLDSVEKWCGDYELIRLTDETVGQYVEIPEEAARNCRRAGLAQYSDMLRLTLLSSYGGVWLDATVMLTGPLPLKYFQYDFFMFQRDTDEPHKDYWENVYAYYYGWREGFRVNMLSSVMFAHSNSVVISDMCGLFLMYWKGHTEMPDYFFLQILFDVFINGVMCGRDCPIESDCKPHYLQQLRNDPSFPLATEDEILRMISIHKLTYK